MPGRLAHVDEQLGREDVEALLRDGLGPPELGVGVAQLGVVEVGVAGLALLLVQVGGEVLGDEPVEEHAEHVGLEVPPVDAASKIVRDPPDGLVQLCPLGFLARRTHCVSLAGGGPRFRPNAPGGRWPIATMPRRGRRFRHGWRVDWGSTSATVPTPAPVAGGPPNLDSGAAGSVHDRQRRDPSHADPRRPWVLQGKPVKPRRP